MHAKRGDVGRVVRRLLTRARDRLALVLATLLLALLHDDGLAHMALDVAAERRARERAQ